MRGAAASAALLLLWAVLGAAVKHAPPAPGLLLNLMLFPLFIAAATAIHEGGHALAGWLAGLRVVRVCVGVGTTWQRFKLGRTEVRLREFPLGGMTWLVPRSERGIRWRMWTAVLAGPLANATVLLATLAMTGVGPESLLVHDRFAPAETWIIAHVGVLVISLLPGHVPSGAGIAVSDGHALLEIPLMTEPERDRLMSAGQVVAAREACDGREHERALAICAAGLKRDPDSVALRNVQGCVLMEQRRFEEACEIFAELLRRDGLELGWRDVLRSNLAWSALRLPRQEALQEALHHSELAFRRRGEADWARTTHGAVLVQLGRYDEAIELLQLGLSPRRDRASQAHDACWLAVAEARLGNANEAERYLRWARELDPSCYSLADAEWAMQLAEG